jgi:hypothetical protein
MITGKNFEIALHRWDEWEKTIKEGRKVLHVTDKMEGLQSWVFDKLATLALPRCPFLELYCICCIFSDYDEGQRFYFDRITVPDWLPLKFVKLGADKIQDLHGKRIYPPEVWSDSDFAFWQRSQNAMFDSDTCIVIPKNHPVRLFMRRGRPLKITPDAETLLE